MAIVQNGKVVQVGPNEDPDTYVKCDRCGRTFPIKFVYCVCKG